MTILFCMSIYVLVGVIFNLIAAVKWDDYRHYFLSQPFLLKTVLVVIWPYLACCLVYGALIGIKKEIKGGTNNVGIR